MMVATFRGKLLQILLSSHLVAVFFDENWLLHAPTEVAEAFQRHGPRKKLRAMSRLTEIENGGICGVMGQPNP